MEVLLEYRGSRRQITVSGGESITECVTTELRRVGRSSASVYTADHNLQNTEERDVYLLQKWSPQWDCFVDIRNTNEIHDGDRLTVVPKPKPPSKVSANVKIVLVITEVEYIILNVIGVQVLLIFCFL